MKSVFMRAAAKTAAGGWRMNIELVEPACGSVTGPLQMFPWPVNGQPPSGDDWAAPVRWDDLKVQSFDRSLPRPVSFRWHADGSGLYFDLKIADNPRLDNPHVVNDVSSPGVDVLHLHIGARYYWQVSARKGAEVIAQSPVWDFQTNSKPPRWIFVPGITNVRDIGGWPLPGGRTIRQGVVYRSSEMNGHLEITEEGKRMLVDELHIRTDLDLRGGDENARPALDEKKVKWINIPILPYLHVGDPAWQDSYRRIFDVFADPGCYPLIFHCWGGADRTGTLALLMHALLGKKKDALICDYELTSLSIWGERRVSSSEFQSLLDVLSPFHGEPDNLQAQVENYLLSIGVSADAIKAIRIQLVA